MTHASPHADIDPDALFVIACPICFGQVAAVARMTGTAACCPLCAGSFRVPKAMLAAALAPAQPPVAPAAAPAPAPAPALASVENVAQAAPAAEAPSPTPLAESVPAAVEATPEALLQTPEPAPFQAQVEPAFQPVPVAAPAPAVELQFHDPVKTVGAGRGRIELRRLTDEERRLRRSRRNLMLLLVGAALLIVIVVMLGIPTQRR
jgi:hypothetical protein